MALTTVTEPSGEQIFEENLCLRREYLEQRRNRVQHPWIVALGVICGMGPLAGPVSIHPLFATSLAERVMDLCVLPLG